MKPGTKSDTPAEVQAVFDALDAFAQAGRWINANSSVQFDGSGVLHTIEGYDNAGNRQRYEERVAGVRVTILPAQAALASGGAQSFTATATNPDGTPVAGATFTWTVNPPAQGTIQGYGANALYTAPSNIAAQTYDTVVATESSAGGAWASVMVQLTPPAPGEAKQEQKQ